jgi:hypothetical protein
MFAVAAPAGSHRPKTVMPFIIDARNAGFCADGVADAGYTLDKDNFLLPLQEAGIPITFRPMSHQKAAGASIGGARVLLGQLFSQHVPDALVDLQLPGRNASEDDRKKSRKLFEQRAPYRHGLHKRSGDDGTTRWRCAFCAGRVRSRGVRKSMRRSRRAPRRQLSGVPCCDGILLVGAGNLPLMQITIVGTTAWWESVGAPEYRRDGQQRTARRLRRDR